MNTKRYTATMLAATLLAAAATGSTAANADQVETTYEVSVSGVAVLKVNYDIDISGQSYRSHASVKTIGMATMFSDYRMELSASGSLAQGMAEPVTYQSRAEKKKKKKNIGLDWSGGGKIAQTGAVEDDPELLPEIGDALNGDVTDPLTAALRFMTSATGRPCHGKQRVFDGRDVYELSFRLDKELAIDDDSDGIYRGTAYQCRLTYTPIAGADARKAKKRKSPTQEFSIWFAPVQTQALGAPVLMPVLAAGKLDGHDFTAYTRRATIDGRPFNEQSQATK